MEYSVFSVEQQLDAHGQSWLAAAPRRPAAPGGVVLCSAPLDAAAAVEAALGTLLTGADRARVDGAAHPARRAELLIGRCLLRAALTLLGVPGAGHGLRLDARGRPYLDGDADGWQFSIAHADDTVAGALARGVAIGMDLERRARRLSAARLAPRILDPRERAHVDALHGEALRAALLRAWVGKEAVLKATGEGVHGVTRSVRVLGEPDGALRTDPASGRRRRWTTLWPPLAEHLLTCVATPAPVTSLVRWPFQADRAGAARGADGTT